jgi:hypothetical protein
MERMKAKVIDEFVRNAMSPFQKSFLKWARWTRIEGKIEFGNQVKAGFSLTSLMTRFLRANKEKYLRYSLRQIGYNPDKVMTATFNKMLRAAGVNLERAFLSWKMDTYQADRKKMALAKRNLAAGNIGNAIDVLWKRRLRAGLKVLAAGVAETKMQKKIINRLYFIAFGKLRNSFVAWTEVLEHMRKALNEKRQKVIEKLALSTMSKHSLAFLRWKTWIKRQLYEENLMKSMIGRMLKGADLMQYNLFNRWKLDVFNDKEKRRQMLRNRKLNAMWDCLTGKHRNNLKSGFNGIAGDSMNTAMRQRILAKLGQAYFGRMEKAFDNWKYDVFADKKARMEQLKAKVIDEFVRSAMSPLQ